MSTKEAYKQKIEAEVELAQAKLAKLKAEAKNSAADVRIEYENQIEELEQKIGATKTKLKELSEASEEAWEHMKSGVENAWNTLSAAVKGNK
jgi:chromosome segregation ATPase